MNAGRLPNGVMLNAYPDSVGGTLDALVDLLRPGQPLADTASLFYILPSLYNSDLDRGFSVVDYDINNVIATEQDLRDLKALGLELKLDFVLNHISVQSPQFRDLLARGDESPYVDFFVDWNEFWAGEGEMGADGYIIPNAEHMAKLFMRKPGLPLLEVPFPDGSSRFYWNTFYQSVTVDPPTATDLQTEVGLAPDVAERLADEIAQALAAGEPISLDDKHRQVERYIERERTKYLGQMDLNAQSDAVWDYYDESLRKMRDYGARIIRLDAFAYLHKEVGRSNFFNEPGTWDYLNRLKQIADGYGLLLLPEIHSRYDEGIHGKLADNGFAFYDFFFPGLVIDAIETGNGSHLLRWIREVVDQGYLTVNMLGCHDGIPLLDIKGLLDEAAIDRMIETILARGGMVKDLYGPDGKKISYYQVNATFFSALNADPSRFLLARAIQMFMPGVPEVWYLDLFAGTNDHQAAEAGGHKEINRTNLTLADVAQKLSEPVVEKQIELLRFRNQFPAFGFDASLAIDDSDPGVLRLTWTKDDAVATLQADLATHDFAITYEEAGDSHRLEI